MLPLSNSQGLTRNWLNFSRPTVVAPLRGMEERAEFSAALFRDTMSGMFAGGTLVKGVS